LTADEPKGRWQLDVTAVADVAVLAGLAMILYGLALLSQPAAWIYAGIVLVIGAIVCVLPAKARPDEPAPLRQKP